MVPEGSESATGAQRPLPQRLIERPWLLAIAAIVFWALSYIVWGLYELSSVGGA